MLISPYQVFVAQRGFVRGEARWRHFHEPVQQFVEHFSRRSDGCGQTSGEFLTASNRLRPHHPRRVAISSRLVATLLRAAPSRGGMDWPAEHHRHLCQRSACGMGTSAPPRDQPLQWLRS